MRSRIFVFKILIKFMNFGKINIFRLLRGKMNMGKVKNHITKPRKLFIFVNFALLFVLGLSLGMNYVLLTKTSDVLGIESGVLSQVTSKAFGKTDSNFSNSIELTGDIMQDVVKLVISGGVPEIYGVELSVSFDQVQQSINIMRKYDPTYGKQKITLSGDDLQRYIDVGLRISCEYCCGVKSIIREDGQAACGCAHSIAMRGLLAYLIQNHGTEYTNDELLRELARWKGMYFPKQMIKKMAEQIQNGNYTPDTASLVLGLELPDYGGGNNEAPLPSDIENLPSMVGGC